MAASSGADDVDDETTLAPTTNPVSTSGGAASGNTTANASTDDGRGSSGAIGSSGTSVLPCAAIAETSPSQCSVQGAVDVALTIRNQCETVTIELSWIDYVCDEISFGVFGPGESLQLTSFATHPWRVRNAATGDLLGDFPGLSDATPQQLDFPRPP